MAFKVDTSSPRINDDKRKSTYKQVVAESMNRTDDGAIDKDTIPDMLSDMDKLKGYTSQVTPGDWKQKDNLK